MKHRENNPNLMQFQQANARIAIIHPDRLDSKNEPCVSLSLCYQPGPVPFDQALEMARSLKAKRFFWFTGGCFLIQIISMGFPSTSGWWFGTFFIFPYIGNNHPNWLSYFSEGWPNHQPDMVFLLSKLVGWHYLTIQKLDPWSICFGKSSGETGWSLPAS